MKKRLFTLSLFSILFVILILNFVSSLQIQVYPQDSNGNSQPNTAFAYTYVFSNDSACVVSNLNYSTTIATDNNGTATITVQPFNVSYPPSYACEYRNSSLRKVFTIQNNSVNNLYGYNATFASNISALNFVGSGAFLTSVLNYSNILSNQTYNNSGGYFNVTNATSSTFIVNATGAFINGTFYNINFTNIVYPYAINGSTFALNYSNFSNIYAYTVNGSNTLNYSNILSNQTYNNSGGYFNVTNATSSLFVVNNSGVFINGSIINFNFSNIVYAYHFNGSTLLNGTTTQYNATFNQQLTLGLFNVSNSSNYPSITTDASANVTLGSGSATTVFLKGNGVFSPTCGAANNLSILANNSGVYICGVTGAWTKAG